MLQAANYANATRSCRRWRVLEALLRVDGAMARPLLIDGLWDGDVSYRERCIEHCDPAWSGVRPRLEELARSPGTGRAASRKLAGG